MRPDLRTLLVLALLVLVGPVVVVRAGRLARHPERLDGIDERKWHAWAARDTRVGPALAAAERELTPGETVYLLAHRDMDPEWLRILGLYHLPRQQVHVVQRGSGRVPPPEVTVVVVDRHGRATVRKGARAGAR